MLTTNHNKFDQQSRGGGGKNKTKIQKNHGFQHLSCPSVPGGPAGLVAGLFGPLKEPIEGLSPFNLFYTDILGVNGGIVLLRFNVCCLILRCFPWAG